MTDTTTTPAPPEGDDESQKDTTTTDTTQTFDADYVKKLRTEAARYRTEAKANADAAKKLADIEDAQKTETQRLTERVTAAEKSQADAELRAMRLEVAADKGLTVAQAKRLTGTTVEELAADADDLIATFTHKTPPPTRKPQDGTRTAPVDDAVPPPDPAKIADQVLSRII